MKNLYLIPTDKPSRLLKSAFGLKLLPTTSNGWGKPNQNIYIASDEEIKEGDWCLYSTKEDTDNEQSIPIICKITRILDSQDGLLYEGSTGLVTQYPTKLSKIILTTDQELIKDRVQKIDDDFLQWFIKNSSCEFVEVDSFCKYGDNCPSKGAYDKQHLCDVGYKIIIPEVPNPFELPNVLPDDVFNKSLEEDAERATGIKNSTINSCCKKRIKTAGGFIWKYKFDYDLVKDYWFKKFKNEQDENKETL